MTWTERVWALFSTAAHKVAKYIEVYSDAQVFVGTMKPSNTYLEFPYVPHMETVSPVRSSDIWTPPAAFTTCPSQLSGQGIDNKTWAL